MSASTTLYVKQPCEAFAK